MKNFNEFWEYLLQESIDLDAYWLDDWLEDRLEKYKKTPPCDECGQKLRDLKSIWDKTRNYKLEERVICCGCGQIFYTIDNKPALMQRINAGDIKQKHIVSLKSEINHLVE